jgi:hypothetical protein
MYSLLAMMKNVWLWLVDSAEQIMIDMSLILVRSVYRNGYSGAGFGSSPHFPVSETVWRSPHHVWDNAALL